MHVWPSWKSSVKIFRHCVSPWSSCCWKRQPQRNCEFPHSRKKIKRIKETVIKLQACSMRDSLMFSGISEKVKEDLETTVSDFIQTHLKLLEDIVKNIAFHCVHRLGSRRAELQLYTAIQDRQIHRHAQTTLTFNTPPVSLNMTTLRFVTWNLCGVGPRENMYLYNNDLPGITWLWTTGKLMFI